MDFFKLIAWIGIVSGFIGMFMDDFQSTRVGRVGSFLAFTLPICGKIVGWW